MSDYDLLAAQNLWVARNVAEIDCGWKRVGPHMWETPDGRCVRYVFEPQQLYGCRGSTLYLGHRWYFNHEWRRAGELEAMAGVGGLTIKRLPE
jgi:hypothetical protein